VSRGSRLLVNSKPRSSTPTPQICTHVRLQTLRDLSIREYGVLLFALAVVVTVRIALWLLPSRLIIRFASHLPEARHVTLDGGQTAASTIVWAVDAIARRMTCASCLTQALSAKLLLAWCGHRSTLCLGVAHTDDGSFRAHAWLEREGRPVLGGAGIHSMVRLPELSDARARISIPRR